MLKWPYDQCYNKLQRLKNRGQKNVFMNSEEN